MADFIGALDQGTTSTRFVIFDHDGREVARHQLEHRQLLARPGWVEHDPMEIWDNSIAVVEAVLNAASLRLGDLAGIGVANQRETTVVWERSSGRPIGPAIVWQDARTHARVAALVADGSASMLTERTGLPPSTYSSATKLQWILDETPGGRSRAERGELCFGTIDSWIAWKMTGRHVTDVTNASRTMLMSLETLDWDDELLDLFAVPKAMLPPIGPSTRHADDLVAGGIGAISGDIALCGLLGDQQAAMVGQGCFAPGEAKNTYGTGNFLLVNTGAEIVRSRNGLMTTVCCQLTDGQPSYALEGAIAVTGAAVQWLRDQLGVIAHTEDVESMAKSVPDTDGLYFVPAFSGLFAPYWRADARGVIVGMARSHHRGHIARAVLEAAGYQSADVLSAVEADLDHQIRELHVDGGMTANELCMQIQADILGIPIVRAAYPETTVLGAAFAAGLGSGFWHTLGDLPTTSTDGARRWEPSWDAGVRAAQRRGWTRAVERSLGWLEAETP